MAFLTQDQKDTLLLVFSWFGIAIGSMIVIVLLIGGTVYAYDNAYSNKFFRGVQVAHVSLDGLTKDEARTKLEQKLAEIYGDGYVFVFAKKTASLSAVQVSLNDPDLSQELIQYDLDETLNTAFAIGRKGDIFTQNIERLQLLLHNKSLPVAHLIQKDIITQSLNAAFEQQITLAKDARIEFQTTSTEAGFDIHISPDAVGVTFDDATALKILSKQADQLTFSPIHLDTIRIKPQIRQGELEPLKDQAPAILAHAPFRIRYIRSTWLISKDTLATWLGAVPNGDGFTLGIVPEKMTHTLTELGSNLIRSPQDGKLIVDANDAVKKFVEPVAGQAIDAEKTIEHIYTLWENGSSGTADLALQTIEPTIQGQDAERLGIREVLGIGRSDFSGSPSNRRYNINYGAQKMNGTLIAPGGEFSQLKALGPINGSTGWLPELVIKGNETLPEYGGGLCQIGTTSFRAALASGLEITERRNHSYRVSYYEPAGTDATIYEPAPDFRFRNNTAHYILVTSRTEGNEVVTTVWGTRDGRVAEQTKPVVFNITAPPPAKLIETTKLAPGVKKCTESAHAGASAKFDYTVTYADGTKSKETFNSYYRPWQAVCLIGVDSPTDTSSSTNMSTSPASSADIPLSP